MKGRKPKPVALKLLEGNPGHRPIGNAPMPATKLPRCPPHLSSGAKKTWARLGPKFAALGVMAEVDEMAFAMFCQAYADWCELIGLARKDGPVVRVNGQPQPNPYAVRAEMEGLFT